MSSVVTVVVAAMGRAVNSATAVMAVDVPGVWLANVNRALNPASLRVELGPVVAGLGVAAVVAAALVAVFVVTAALVSPTEVASIVLRAGRFLG